MSEGAAGRPAASDLRAWLEAIETSLDQRTYRAGPWQRFLEAASRAPRGELRDLQARVTRVSDKLHRRKQPRSVGFQQGLALESLGACAGVLLLGLGAAAGSAFLLVAAAGMLGVTLQPLLKVSTGLALGLKYSYAYLWHGEPRFKLEFGSYLAAAPWKRVVVHLSGMLGSPLAWFVVSAVARPSHPTLGAVLFWLFALHLLFQAGLLLLAVCGVRRIPVVGLLRLSSPGGAGFELRQWLDPGRARQASA